MLIDTTPISSAGGGPARPVSPGAQPSFDPTLAHRARARKVLAAKRQHERYRDNPWLFLTEAVITIDPHDKKTPLKPFPDLAYLKRFTEIWLANRRVLVPKSRRMIISWTCIALHVWLMLFFEHEYIFFAARKEGRNESQGSLELVKRAKMILENFKNFTPPPTTSNIGSIFCPKTGSHIEAVPEGGNQFRQLTATAIFADEMAFWEDARKTYTSAIPTIEANGRFTGVSTANPSFFCDLVHDRV